MSRWTKGYTPASAAAASGVQRLLQAGVHGVQGAGYRRASVVCRVQEGRQGLLPGRQRGTLDAAHREYQPTHIPKKKRVYTNVVCRALCQTYGRPAA